jgi:hypothetical protein
MFLEKRVFNYWNISGAPCFFTEIRDRTDNEIKRLMTAERLYSLAMSGGAHHQSSTSSTAAAFGATRFSSI